MVRVFTHKQKRNAYKINPESSAHGNLTIDVPKLYGQLRLVSYQNKKNVYDKQVDFETLDLLTKQYNSRKKYSPLSKMVFDDLNKISEILIHRTSNKYKKIGSGVAWRLACEQALGLGVWVFVGGGGGERERNESLQRCLTNLNAIMLLGGSIMAVNKAVKDESTHIAHTLNKLGVMNNYQLNDLINEYVI